MLKHTLENNRIAAIYFEKKIDIMQLQLLPLLFHKNVFEIKAIKQNEFLKNERMIQKFL